MPNLQTQLPAALNHFLHFTSWWVLVLALHSPLPAQISSKIWYFGQHAGLDFRTDPPTALYNPRLNNQESNVSLTDSAGNLLFYVTADKVYNRVHEVMDNGDGLLGNGGSSAQGPMVLQDPSNNMRYYVFMTADETYPQFSGNLHYSIVDLCENNGLGKVLAGFKNIQIRGNFSERLSAIPMNQGKAYWILTSKLFENTIISFYFDHNGIDTSKPVYSFFGMKFSPQVGQIKVNNNRSQILYSAGLNSSGNGVWLMDYDILTGKASNQVEVSYGTHDYGIEFSPNDSILYYTSFYVTSAIYQYEIASRIKTKIKEYPSNYQLASINKDPNNKLIISRGLRNEVSAILHPNIKGALCSYVEGYIKLLPNTFGHLGLQNLSLYFDSHKVNVKSPFLGNDTLICNSNGYYLNSDYSNTVWSTGDTGTSIFINQSGIYWAKKELNCQIFIDSINIEFYNYPNSIIPLELNLCDGQTDTLVTQEEVLWSDGSRGKQLLVKQAGTYWAEINTPCGDLRDSVTVSLIPKLQSPAPLRDTVLCSQNVIDFALKIDSAHWNTGDYETLRIGSAGVYGYTISNECEEIRDSFRLTIDSVPWLLPEKILACPGETVILNAGNDHARWSTGELGRQIQVFTSGRYEYNLENACGNFNSSVDVLFETNISLFLGTDTLLCDQDSLWLTSPYDNTFWSNGQTGNKILVRNSGIYWASIFTSCDTLIDTINIQFDRKINLQLGENRILCDGQTDTLVTQEEVLWSDGSRGKQLLVKQAGTFWAEINTPCGDLRDSVTVSIIPKLQSPAPLRDTVLCRKNVADFVLKIDSARWNTGDYETLRIGSAGVYAYTIANECEEIRDSFRLTLDSVPWLLPEKIMACPGETVILISGNDQTRWNTGEMGRQIQVFRSGRYQYTLDNACGLFTSSADVEIDEGSSTNQLPNVFSPNGDRVNDEFPGENFTATFHLKIFSRWGELIFEGRNQSWDGRFESKAMPPETYVYVIELDACGGQRIKKGSVTLLR